jgi:hypothetical protein
MRSVEQLMNSAVLPSHPSLWHSFPPGSSYSASRLHDFTTVATALGILEPEKEEFLPFCPFILGRKAFPSSPQANYLSYFIDKKGHSTKH